MRSPTVCVLRDMSMRGSAGVENSIDGAGSPGGKPGPPVSSLAGPTLNDTVACVHPVAPLINLLTCREVAPSILEYEKALLVIKEHDYAKAPENPQLMQLSPLFMADETNGCGLTSSGDFASPSSFNRKAMKGVLVNCRKDVFGLRENLARKDEGSMSSHLREVVSLQVTLIREQQEQLHEKDRQLNAVRKEKEQLEARLERMERRLAILQKRSSKANPTEESQPSALASSTPASTCSTPTPRPHISRTETLANSERYPRSRSSSVDHSRSRSRPTSHSGTPVPQEDSLNNLRKPKRRLRGELDYAHDAKKAKKKPTEVRTEFEYCGLNLPVPRDPQNSVTVVCNHNRESRDNRNDISITVPLWRVCPVRSSAMASTKESEDMSDESFLKRHKRLEEDEKRRKRWDLQRIRARREHDELLRKYMLKSGGNQTQGRDKKKDKLTTFIPKPEELEAIEVVDTLAVSAFGYSLPLVKPSEFELPWFDLDVREAKENVRTTRSMAKATRSSASSSAEES